MKKQERQNIQKKVWTWYRANAPLLPWRKTRNPYHIFVSEIMLQQTQILRVKETYPLFLKKFPTVKTLAASPLQSVLRIWHGMGYNRRALYLKRAAEYIIQHHQGTVPKTEAELRALPGIGPYTARAIRCFAHGICEPFIETNIRRVVIHEFFPKKKNVTDNEILQILKQIQPINQNTCRDWYWALMDYGRDALRHVPNPNRNSKQYAKQSKFEGSPRYIRAKIISYILKNKKATGEELFLSLKNDRYLETLSEEDIARSLTGLKKEELVRETRKYFLIT